MLNQIVLVGRIVKGVELEKEGDKNVATMTLAIPRSYKNENGEYETDFIDCVLWNGVAENTSEYCRKGDIVGVKGRVQNRIVKDDEGIDFRTTEIVAEKVTFLSSKKSDEE